ncbi:hypothetical protein HD806DRAFT_529322 [Xylariaceae sp. AK1471]|nr:hypothetical protein HD806DRAFT_529322 [Xylariaceae sp. AK1471]
MEDYYLLAQESSHRRLTVASDKLLAFLGLARGLRRAFNDFSPSADSGTNSSSAVYLAGLWALDIYRGLTWYKGIAMCAHVPVYRASSDERVLFSRGQPKHTLFNLGLLDYKIEPRDSGNPFGKIAYVELVVCGRITRLRRSRQVFEIHVPGDGIVGCDFDVFETPEDKH